MIDFIYKLYGYDNFTLYLTIAIVVLIILFVLVLIFGKKDQKLEETKRLQRIELEQAFKKENEEPVKLETNENEIKEETKEELPVVEEPEMPSMSIGEEPLPVQEAEVTVFEPMEIEEDEILPELNYERPVKVNSNKDTDEENAPIKVDELPEFSFDDINDSIEKGLNELESIKEEFNSIEIPEVQKEDKVEVKEEPKAFQPSQVFSSVFVKKDEKEEEKSKEPVLDETPSIKFEEPVVKSEPTLIIQDEEDFDLPTLKIMDEEPKEEVKVEEKKEESSETFSFDDLVGETYNIK